MGEMAVTVMPTTYQNAKAKKMVITTVLDGSNNLGEDEEAIWDDKGLAYFKRQTREEGLNTFIEGVREADRITVQKKVNEQKFSYGIPLEGLEISEYEMDLPDSPFFKMGISDRKMMNVFSVDEMAVVPAVRVIAETKETDFKGKRLDIFVVNTSIGQRVIHSWFDVKRHRLIYERQRGRVLKRIE